MSRPRLPYGTSQEELERLSSIETDECVLWPYAQDRHGYGRVKVGEGTSLTHRLSCERVHGAPPADKQHAAHSCNNPPCLNPRHLRWDNAAGNMADTLDAGTRLLGSEHPNAKLTEVEVREIRDGVTSGTPQKFYANKYGLHSGTVSTIVARKAWRWLT